MVGQHDLAGEPRGRDRPGAGLVMEGVAFAYGRTPVFAGLDFAVEPGAMVALLGQNGSGKSTLLNLAAGVLRPRSGSVAVGGRPVAAYAGRDRARTIAMVPQGMHVPFAFTVRELVGLGRTPYLSTFGGERDEDGAAVLDAMRAAHVEHLAGRLVSEVSGGERQRAALAMALAQSPHLLLLDEPTAHLDVRHQLGMLALARRLNRQRGLTIVAAIHDFNLASLWFDRLALLHRGRILVEGSPGDVLRAELLGQVFETPVRVLEHPAEGVPLIALLRPPGTGESAP